jgi:hypothetical protein
MPFLVLFTGALLSARPAALEPPRVGGRGRTVALLLAAACLLGVWAGEAAVVLRV